MAGEGSRTVPGPRVAVRPVFRLSDPSNNHRLQAARVTVSQSEGLVLQPDKGLQKIVSEQHKPWDASRDLV